MISHQRRVTIGDVARRARVSTATVSRVVNGGQGVAAATVARVQQVVTDLGYESSLIARSLRSTRTSVIGILVPDIGPFTAEVMKGAFQATVGTGYELIVYTSGRPLGERAGWERRLLTRTAGTLTDGTILVTPADDYVPPGHPVVVVDAIVGHTTVPFVASQNRQGAADATAHLIGLGHRRIAFVGVRPDLESVRLREAGFRDAMREAGLAVDPDLVAHADDTPAHTRAAVQRLLDHRQPPTAILAANDVTALVAVSAARERGVRVPDDLSVVGFDNTPDAALADPPLTTVDQSLQHLGRTAVRLLLDQIADDGGNRRRRETAQVYVPTSLVVRASSAPPRR